MPARNAARRTATNLPAEPPQLRVPEPPLTLKSLLHPKSPPQYAVGNPASLTPTLRLILRESLVRDGRQTLIRTAKRWFVWTDDSWVMWDEEEVEAFIYRSLVNHGWPATSKHVSGLLRLMRLELAWSPMAARCVA